ncbi:MAG: hypothetical protein KDK24_19325 [Pseudooceanicola sp.]|nr:hypothetical protein [Pseudooceanicola sp.]MCB1395542.1 hypothetical protein [Paracoccaceae bacterium]
MRSPLILLLAGAVAACSSQVPDSGRGITSGTGFDALRAQELAEAEATSEGNGLFIPPSAVSDEALPPAPVAGAQPTSPSSTLVAAAPAVPTPAPGTASAADIAAETAAALAASNANSGVAPLEASPSNPPPAIEGHAGLSTENDFKSVSNARTIEGDAEQIARNRQQYQLIQPTALPARDGQAGPNIVNYALETRNDRGAAVYKRIGINLAGRAQRACARYPSPDRAQMDFLSSGGPERDKLGLDPDGDGFACDWNPAPFRAAVKQ